MDEEEVSAWSDSEKALRLAGVKRPEYLWDHLERGGDLGSLALDSKVDETTLLTIMRRHEPPERGLKAGYRRLLPNVFLIMLVLLATGSVIRGNLSRLSQDQVVVGPQDLAQFSIVTPEDVTVRRTVLVEGSFDDPRAAVGRMVLRPVPANAVLSADQLGPRFEAPTTGRRIVTFPLEAVALKDLEVGQRISLLLSPRASRRAPTASTILDDVVVLSFATSPPAITVAVRERDLSSLAQYLGSAAVFVVR